MDCNIDLEFKIYSEKRILNMKMKINQLLRLEFIYCEELIKFFRVIL